MSEKLEEVLQPKDGLRKMDRKGTMRVENMTDMLMNRFEKETKLREDLKMLKESYVAFRQKIDYNSELVKQVEHEVQGSKKSLKTEYKGKIAFLQKLLKTGLDCRNQGLTWIIKGLWTLGEKVYENHLPDFLDSKGKVFVINVLMPIYPTIQIANIYS